MGVFKLKRTNLGKVAGECRSLVGTCHVSGWHVGGACPSEEMGVIPRQGRRELGLEGLEASPYLRVPWNSSAETAARSLLVLWLHKRPVEAT